MKIFKAKMEISAVVLILLWLLLLFLPYLVFRTGIKSYFNAVFLQNRINAELLLNNEMECFRRDFDDKAMLETKLTDFDSLNGFMNHENNASCSLILKTGSGFAETIRTRLEQHLGFKVMNVFFHGPDCGSVDFSFNPKIAGNIKIVPKIMMRRMFAVFSNQSQKNILNPIEFKWPFPSNTDIQDPKVRKNYGSGFLAFLFKTMSDTKIEPGKLFRVAASKAGNFSGNLYFYYSKAEVQKNNENYNAGGYLAVIRQCDIPAEMVKSYAAERILNERLDRKVVQIAEKVPFPDDYSKMGFTGFRHVEGQFVLRSFMPQTALVHKIQVGTFNALNWSDFSDKTSLLEVSISEKSLQHSLKKYLPGLMLFVNLAIIFFSAMFVKIGLFGLDFSASISTKVAFAATFICLVPVTSLCMLYLINHDYNTILQKENLLAFLENKNSQIRQKINEHIRLQKEKGLALARFIERKGIRSRKRLLQLFKKWAPENQAELIMFQYFEDEKISYLQNNSKNMAPKKGVYDLKLVFFNAVIEFLLSSPLISESSTVGTNLLTAGSGNASSIHQALINKGRLDPISRVSKNSLVSVLLLFKSEKFSRAPVGCMAIDYRMNEILKQALEKEFINYSFQDNFAGYEIDIAFADTSRNFIQLVENRSSSALEAKIVLDDLEKYGSSDSGSRIMREFSSKDAEHVILQNTNQFYPYSIYIKASRRIKKESDIAFIWMGLFLFLVIAASVQMARLLFVDPLLKLARGLQLVAEGNLQTRFAFDGNDEFSDLATELNLMTAGLIEKEKLGQYVSSEVLAEINKASEAEMSPGGERIEAVVLFSTFIAEHQSVREDQQLFDLDMFLGVCNSICSQNFGVIDKIIGNTIMMVFRAEHKKQKEADACNSATQIHQAMASIKDKKYKCFSGISSGKLVSGKIGSKKGKLDFTVIGDAVNLAARLKSCCVDYHGKKAKQAADQPEILLCKNTFEQVKDRFEFTELPPVKIKGKSGLVSVFSLKI
jgi:class 3 adenylate cyclase